MLRSSSFFLSFEFGICYYFVLLLLVVIDRNTKHPTNRLPGTATLAEHHQQLIVMTTIIPQQREIQPILIPIRKQLKQQNPIQTLPSTQSDTNVVDVSEWAMIEINGELIAPSTLSANSTSDVATDGNCNSGSDLFDTTTHFELGSIYFQDKVP
jgi:hypothetical protein